MNNIYKDIKSAAIIVMAICLVTIFIQIVLQGVLNLDIIKEQFFYNIYYGFPLSFFMSWFFDFLDKRISWDENPKLRAVLGIVGTVIMTMLILVILNFILWTVIEGKPIGVLWLKENRLFYIIGMVITVVVTSVIHAIGFFNEVQRVKKQSYELRQQKLSSELNALRAHVDPHFLFNSFNVLSGLIDEDKDRAQTFLSGLSSIYRYILEQRNEQTCTLEEELGFAKRYLELQHMRFENGIRLETDISTTYLERKVPSLTLQLLLENAIKHNAFDAKNPLVVKLSIEEDSLIIRNNYRPKKELIKSSGLGLQNITDRYDILSDRKIEVSSNDKEFIVKIPLL